MAFNSRGFAPRQFQALFDVIFGSATVDPGDMAAGAETVTSVTVTGVALGDAVIAFPGVDTITAGAVYSCAVTAANTVKISWINAGGDHINLASSTWRFAILRPKGDFAKI
jgi:hypothetical protein